MKPNCKTCWWMFTKQCRIESQSKACLFYLPTLKGTMDRPDFDTFRRTVINHGLVDLLTMNSAQAHRLTSTQALTHLDSCTQDILRDELTKAKIEQDLYLTTPQWRNDGKAERPKSKLSGSKRKKLR